MDLYDRNGRPVRVGDVLKAYHKDVDKPNKKVYTYKWVTGTKYVGSSKWFVINHLEKVSLEESTSYFLEAKDEIERTIEIIQGNGDNGLEPFEERKCISFS